MTIAVIAGLFSLLGALLGAFLSRRGDHKKWLRERRSLAAEKFLSVLGDCAKVHHANSASDRTHEAIAVAVAFLPAEDYARIVRLYLTAEKRDSFSKLVNEIITLHISLGADHSLHAKLESKMSELQEILESGLDG